MLQNFIAEVHLCTPTVAARILAIKTNSALGTIFQHDANDYTLMINHGADNTLLQAPQLCQAT